MARNLVITTVALWLVFFMFAVGVARMPEVALLPLYGLYPGEESSGEASYHPALMHAWAVGAGVVFVALAIFASWRKNTIAAIILLLLFLVSTGASCARVASALHDLH
jgi:hypothetical protein